MELQFGKLFALFKNVKVNSFSFIRVKTGLKL